MKDLSPALQCLAWALLHFLWQGLIIWGATALALAMARRPTTRYLIACAGLLACVAWPLGTYLLGRGTGPMAGLAEPIQVMVMREGAMSGALPWGLRVKAWMLPYLPAVFTAWMAGTVFLGLRFAGGWAWVQRLRWRGLHLDAALQGRVTRLAQALGVSGRVRIRVSRLVEMPVILGVLRPMILVPASVVTGLSPDALDLILVHELTHARRHDYLVNLLQSAVEVVLFYHPAVWWISGRIRIEREVCCDDAAVAFGGDPAFYARILNRLDDLRTPTPAMAAGGGSVMLRIKRLLIPRPEPARAPWAGLLCAAILSVVCGAGLHAKQADAPKTPAKAPAQAVKTVKTAAAPTAAKAPEAEKPHGIPTYSRAIDFEWKDGELQRISVKRLTHEEILDVLKKIDQLAEDQPAKKALKGRWEFPDAAIAEKDAGKYKSFGFEGVTTAAVRHTL